MNDDWHPEEFKQRMWNLHLSDLLSRVTNGKQMTDEQWMQEAIDSGREGVQKREGGPFGACVVQDGKVVGVGHNTVLKDRDPTCHAEMNAIRAACDHLGTHLLNGCTLYTTAEPCPMCLSAIYWARIDRVVVGVDRECAARYGFDDAEFYRQVSLPVDQRTVPQSTGTKCNECEALFAEWKEIEGALY